MRSSLTWPSEAEKEISSSSRSITVCSRRAPMFWVRSLTDWAMRAIVFTGLLSSSI